MSISPLARVSPKARLGRNVYVGDFTIIHDDVELGDDCRIESHCVVGHPTPAAAGEPLRIGPFGLVRSHSVLYQGSTFGERLETGHHATLREGLDVGRNLRVGTNSDLQGRARIGDYVRIHSRVFVASGAALGSFVWIFPGASLTNDPHPPSNVISGVTVGDYAVVAANACVMPGIRVGYRAVIGANSLVTKDVPPDQVVLGVPAEPLCATSEIKLRDGSGRSAYPWMAHFSRGYPSEIVAEWRARFGPGPSDDSAGGGT